MKRTRQQTRELITTGYLARGRGDQQQEEARCVRIGQRFIQLDSRLPVPRTLEQAERMTRGATEVWLLRPSWWTVVAEFDDPPRPSRAVRLVSGQYRDRVSFALVPEGLPDEEVLALDADDVLALVGACEMQWLPSGVREIGILRRS